MCNRSLAANSKVMYTKLIGYDELNSVLRVTF